MKTSLDHIPSDKADELNKISAIIQEEIAPEKIILFGSFARGDWVDDSYMEEGVRYTYTSDFDILVITQEEPDRKLENRMDWVSQKIKRLHLSRPVMVIYHEMAYINEELLSGSYFFSDIVKEGILLYDAGIMELGKVGVVDAEKVRQRAKSDFEFWFKSATDFLDTFFYDLRKERLNNAAFILHQVTERFYASFLLVFTGYKPKTHDLIKLGKEAAKVNKKLLTVFPVATKEQEQNFILLQKAYVEARYNKHYKITKEQLEYLAICVERLRDLVNVLCTERLQD